MICGSHLNGGYGQMEEIVQISTDKNVIEIAQEVGYSDSKHFYNVFKKFTGKRPKDFR